MTTLVITIGLISLMLLLFVVLTTFWNSTRAYAAISLVPLSLALILLFLRSVSVQPDYSWADLYEKIVWATSIQMALGIVLIARAVYRRRPLGVLTFTTFLTGSMVWLRLFRRI